MKKERRQKKVYMTMHLSLGTWRGLYTVETGRGRIFWAFCAATGDDGACPWSCIAGAGAGGQ